MLYSLVHIKWKKSHFQLSGISNHVHGPVPYYLPQPQVQSLWKSWYHTKLTHIYGFVFVSSTLSCISVSSAWSSTFRLQTKYFQLTHRIAVLKISWEVFRKLLLEIFKNWLDEPLSGMKYVLLTLVGTEEWKWPLMRPFLGIRDRVLIPYLLVWYNQENKRGKEKLNFHLRHKLNFHHNRSLARVSYLEYVKEWEGIFKSQKQAGWEGPLEFLSLTSSSQYFQSDISFKFSSLYRSSLHASCASAPSSP